MGGIFDDFQVVVLSDFQNLTVSHGWPAMWTGMMALVLEVISASICFRVHIQRLGLTVHEYGIGPEIEHDFSCRGKGHRRHDNVVALFDADRVQSQVESGRSGIDGYPRGHNPNTWRSPLQKVLTFGPVVSHPDLSVSTTDWISSHRSRVVKWNEFRTHKSAPGI